MPQLGCPPLSYSYRENCQQGKMKMHHDKHAKFREMAVGETVLVRDHLSSQKWQPGTVRQHSSPHSYQVQLDDG